jgi:hypothetical protein
MRFATLTALAVASTALAFPRATPEMIRENLKRVQNQQKCSGAHQKSRKFILPAYPKDTRSEPRPDAAHPYIAPGPGDTRGPCPALNTLANHGYIPRNGFCKTEEIIEGVMTGFNMEHDFACFLASFATMVRGNPNLAMLSIGHPGDEIPPVPGCFDGPVAGGLATHGRFEGDVSMSRRDISQGDNVNFQNDVFDVLLLYTGKFGDDGPEGKHTVLNDKVFAEFKYDTFLLDQARDPKLEYHIARQTSAFSEVGFALDLLANGRLNNTISASEIGSFFRNQTFPKNWSRRTNPAGLQILSTTGGKAMSAHPVPPGMNDKNGNYVADVPHFTNFLCDSYENLASAQIHKDFMKQTGIFKENVLAMASAMYKPFHDYGNCTTKVFPSGPECSIQYKQVAGQWEIDEFIGHC